MIRVGIIDDDPLIREEIRFLLQTHSEAFELAFEAPSMGRFFEVLDLERRPDIVLLDISLAEQNSLEQIGKLRRLLPRAKVVIITGHTESELLIKALRNGAHGYFVKSNRPERILEVIRETHRGGTFIEPQMAGALLPHFRREKSPTPPGNTVEGLHQNASLNAREREVAQGLADGMAYKEIAATLHISINTVRHYVKSLYRKLGISSKRELIALLSRKP